MKVNSNLIFSQKKRLIGGIGFQQVKLNSYELGNSIAYEKWGNGYVSDAVSEALSYLEKDNNCDIFANYLVGNSASANLLQKKVLELLEK